MSKEQYIATKSKRLKSKTNNEEKDDFFTKSEVIEQCADLVTPYINNFLKTHKKSNLIYIDFSAGRNEFAQLLHLPYIAIDLYEYPESVGEIIYQDWLKTRLKQFKLPSNTEIIIGLN